MNVLFAVGVLVLVLGVFAAGFLVGKKHGARVAAAVAKVESAVG